MDFGSSLMSVRSYMTVYLCVCQCVFVGRTVRLGTVLCQVWWPACVLGRYLTTQSRQTVGQTTSSAHPGHCPFLDHITMQRIICSLLLQMQHGLCVCLLVPGKRLNWWRCHLRYVWFWSNVADYDGHLSLMIKCLQIVWYTGTWSRTVFLFVI